MRKVASLNMVHTAHSRVVGLYMTLFMPDEVVGFLRAVHKDTFKEDLGSPKVLYLELLDALDVFEELAGEPHLLANHIPEGNYVREQPPERGSPSGAAVGKLIAEVGSV